MVRQGGFGKRKKSLKPCKCQREKAARTITAVSWWFGAISNSDRRCFLLTLLSKFIPPRGFIISRKGNMEACVVLYEKGE